jgi:hypothetical protein
VLAYAKADPEWAKLHRQVRQNLAVCVDEGYVVLRDRKRRRKQHQPSKAQGREKIQKLHIPSVRLRPKQKRKASPFKIGEFSVGDYRKIRTEKKTATAKFTQGRSRVIVVAELQSKDICEALDAKKEDAGIGLNLTNLLTDSHGNAYDPPQSFEEDRKKFKKEPRRLSRQFEPRKKKWERLARKANEKGEDHPMLSPWM